MTTRGLSSKDFQQVAKFVDEAVKITLDIKKSVKGTKLMDFKEAVGETGQDFQEIGKLRTRVKQFASSFEVVGFDSKTCKY